MKRILFIVLVVFLASCNQEEKKLKNDIKCEVVNVSQYKSEILGDISDLYDSISIIYLNTQAPIGKFEKVICKQDKIYIHDKNGEKVWVFSNKGDSLICIDKQGKGPDEYIRIEDVSISSDGSINILDASQKTVLNYDLNGKLQKRNNLHQWVHNYFTLKSHEYLFSQTPSEKDGYYLNVLKDSTRIKSYFPSTHIWRFDGTEFVYSGDSVFFTRYYDDFIYYFKDKNLHKGYFVDFGNSLLFQRKLQEAESLEKHKEYLKGKTYTGNVKNLSVSDSHLAFDYSEPFNDWEVVSHFFYNKKTKNAISIKSFGDSNKDFYSVGFPITSDGHYFYSIIEPWNLEDLQKRKLEEVIGKPIDENLNCLLCKFILKL